MKTIGFIGVGELALYTIKGLRQGGFDGRILLSPRNREKAAELQQGYACQVQADNQSVVTQSDCVVLATRPADCLEALSGLNFTNGQLLISVVAGVTTEQLRDGVNADVEIVRAMPVSSAEVGSSPTLIYPSHEFVTRLFNYCGEAIPVDDEAYFDQGTVLACVYSWFFSLFDALIESTRGDRLPPELAAKLVMGMARGAADLALANPEQPPGEIADAIATDGTYSRQGLDLLIHENAFDAWQAACRLLQEQLAKD